jgi:AGCS family alanine or glycine:cation symporter
MDSLIRVIIGFSNWIWGVPMLVILFGGGLFMTIRLNFFQFRYLPFICRQTFGNILKKQDGEGTISPFQAATSALASTIGAANIVGVSVAIAFGGPGAVFWMWLTSLVGCAMKYSEIILGIKYRRKNELGEYVGGPMYYLRDGIGYKTLGKFLGAFFAFFLMIELWGSIATQTVSLVQTAESINISKYVSGAVLAVMVSLVVFGGIKRISSVCERLVPFMALLYMGIAFVIVVLNIRHIPSTLYHIFANAFSMTAAEGGFAGATIAAGIRWGVARGCYSNEAGMGTAPLAHSAAITDHPARQAMWGIFEIIADTLLVCSATAFIVIVTDIWKTLPADQAAAMPARAFQALLGDTAGGVLITACILLFVYSTIMVLVYYGEKQAEYLFGTGFSKVMRFVYICAIGMGVVGGLEFLYQFVDVLLAAIIIPNVIGVCMMSGQVKELKEEFFNNPEFYPPAGKKQSAGTVGAEKSGKAIQEA